MNDVFICIRFALCLGLGLAGAIAQEASSDEAELYTATEDFESYEVGEEPDLFILDGTFTVE